MIPRRRETKVLLSLEDVRQSFEQQTPLSVKDALGVIHEAQRLMNQDPNVVDIPRRASTYVFGDIHGQFFDLMQLMDTVGVMELAERDVQLVFLGDYVDRGVFSCEVMLYLLLLKIRFSDKVVLLRGNHECESISSFYGFRNECRVKYGISAYYHFLSCFQVMPVAGLLETSCGKILCVHGGLSPELKSIQDIQDIDRRREVPTEGLLCDLLWSDPLTPRTEGVNVEAEPSWEPNQARGCSYYFNAQATFKFLQENDLVSLIRAHEYEDEGYTFHFNSAEYEKLDNRTDKTLPPLITVFSAPNYCDSFDNTAACLFFQNDPFTWEMQLTTTVGHPAPPIASSERGSDMWRQFNQTLPFLPASKEFFEEVMWLADGKKAIKTISCASNIGDTVQTGVGDVHATTSVENETAVERRRRMTSEMHPQAIRKVLDDEVQKWEHVEDTPLHSAGEDPPRLQRRHSISSVQYSQTDDRTHLLTPQELDTIKLMFSLMDTDGSMVLSSAKISQFVLNILGERIAKADADKYLDALDFDQNGTVDFHDILSWVAVMKVNHHQRESSSLVSWTALQNGARLIARGLAFRKVCLWLALGCLLRDIIVPKHRKVIKSSSVRLLGSASLAIYMIDLLCGGEAVQGGIYPVVAWLRDTIAAIKQKFTSK